MLQHVATSLLQTDNVVLPKGYFGCPGKIADNHILFNFVAKFLKFFDFYSFDSWYITFMNSSISGICPKTISETIGAEGALSAIIAGALVSFLEEALISLELLTSPLTLDCNGSILIRN